MCYWERFLLELQNVLCCCFSLFLVVFLDSHSVIHSAGSFLGFISQTAFSCDTLTKHCFLVNCFPFETSPFSLYLH